jgi:hypothetical protein
MCPARECLDSGGEQLRGMSRALLLAEQVSEWRVS